MKLHWKIIIGLVSGLFYGILSAIQGWGAFTSDWVAPFGNIFFNLLKLVAVPLVLASLITGVASLSDMKKLSRIGGKTIFLYILTTIFSVTIGLIIVNLIQPGATVPDETKNTLQESFQDNIPFKDDAVKNIKERSPLQPVVDMVPGNIFNSVADNRNMLQVVFVAVLIGVGLIQIPKTKAGILIDFFSGLNDVIIKIVEIIMLLAPVGVFALIADMINKVAGNNLSSVLILLGSLGYYMLAVIAGLLIHMTLVYTSILKIFTKMSLMDFVRGIAPAQLLAFSTSSSGATLPVTMERCEKELGVSEEISSFVLPLGATINMDGTALYQAVASVFIAQALGIDLTISQQLTILLTAVLASIGTAAVPGAGVIMLIIILESIGVPTEGIALILGVDRILDMMRTVVNITGDAVIAVLIAQKEGQLKYPKKNFNNT